MIVIQLRTVKRIGTKNNVRFNEEFCKEWQTAGEQGVVGVSETLAYIS